MTPNAATIPEEARPAVKRRGRMAAGADVPGVTRPMTYEEYLASPEEMARYDIIDGWKVYSLFGAKHLPGPTTQHQDIVLNLGEALRAYQRSAKTGRVIIAPRDILITKRPIRTRQPDVMFISSARREKNPSPNDATPLAPAPELVIEIVSPSDKPSVLSAKIADYRAVQVNEVWVVRSEDRTVEKVVLSEEEIKTVASYGTGQSVISTAFPNLRVAVDDIFAE